MLQLVYFNNLSFSNIVGTFESIQLGTYFINFIFGPMLLILVLYSKKMSTFKSLSKFLKLFIFLVTLSVYFFQYKNTDFNFKDIQSGASDMIDSASDSLKGIKSKIDSVRSTAS